MPVSEYSPAREPSSEPECEPETAESAGSGDTESNRPEVRECAKVVSPPVALGRIEPKYPRSARRRGREGSVTVDVAISNSGEVSGAEVVSSSGHADLDSAAVSAVRAAHFSPATEDGAKVESRVRLVFEFRLQ